MAGTVALQAPIDLSSATRVGPRRYRKQILEKRAIDYPTPDGSTQHVEFDDAYLRDLAAAYNDGAYDLVPFQLATPANEHNEDPRNYGGRLVAVEVTEDGLDGILELSDEADELVQRTGGKLGVSARIKPVRHVDGRTFKRAIRHVLGTLDPRMTGMRGWEPVVDLANDHDGAVLDLRNIDQQEGNPMPQTLDLSKLSADERDALETWAAVNDVDLSATEADPDDEQPDEQPDDAPEGDDNADQDDSDDDEGSDGSDDPDLPPDEALEDDGISDDDLNALIDAELAGAGVSLSADDADDEDEPLDLAELATDDTPELDLAAENARMRFQIAGQEYARKGVPPHIIDLAEPILSLTDAQVDTLDLASPVTGEAIDVRGMVRDMLDAVAGTIDLSAEAGYGQELEPEQQAQDRADAWVGYLIENN
jgi:hypothetical protein